jgi:hypothetical protein
MNRQTHKAAQVVESVAAVAALCSTMIKRNE